MVRLGEKEVDHCGSNLTSLREVNIRHCKSLKNYRCASGIEMLTMYACPSITSVSFSRGGQQLKRLHIYDCEKLLEEELEEGGGVKSRVFLNKNMSLLESVHIDNWPNLKSFPDLSCFVHLTSLKIFSCKNLELSPDEELPKLTSLTDLSIVDCQRMDGSFLHGHWPPKLTSLMLRELRNPIFEWGPQKFPTSLVHLTLHGKSSSEDMGQLFHLFPSSLTYLKISEFEKLESLSMELQHLTSLQQLYIDSCPDLIDLPKTLLPSLSHLTIIHCPKVNDLQEVLLPSLSDLKIWDCPKINVLRETFLPSLSHLTIFDCPNINDLREMLLPSLLHMYISDCPKIKHLPVTLLHSLLELKIYKCPKLKEMCSRRGYYWPHVSQIPCVYIDGKLCN